jgi:hypothetical protein
VDLQLAVTVAIVAVAGLYLLRAILRPIFGRGKSGCGPACGKCATQEAPPTSGRIGLPQLPSRACVPAQLAELRVRQLA